MAISGKSGYIKYGATSICIERWSVTTQVPAVDTTNTCTAGLQDNVGGVFTGQITASGPVLLSGTALPTIGSIVVFELGHVISGPTDVIIATFSGIVSSIRNSLDVSGRYEYELSAQSVHTP
jgi:hypothetical protein